MTKIDIVSGFLGAGKTTLINRLIKEAYPGEKLVLIENEFGEIGVDGGFLQEAGVQIAEMNSGCICCSLVGDFSKALFQVLAELQADAAEQGIHPAVGEAEAAGDLPHGFTVEIATDEHVLHLAPLTEEETVDGGSHLGGLGLIVKATSKARTACGGALIQLIQNELEMTVSSLGVSASLKAGDSQISGRLGQKHTKIGGVSGRGGIGQRVAHADLCLVVVVQNVLSDADTGRSVFGVAFDGGALVACGVESENFVVFHRFNRGFLVWESVLSVLKDGFLNRGSRMEGVYRIS